jgi:ubiquinone/menaquinone biosynthesis C-methylase UbiE
MSTKSPEPPAINGHRGFAAFWDWMGRHEPRNERQFREQTAGGCRGRTLELGFGAGANWAYLPREVEYVGIEPDPHMRGRAMRHRQPATASFELRAGDAQALDFDDQLFDTVLATLVFCTIPNAAMALREARRVLRPGGQLRFCEHVRPAGRVAGPFFDAISVPWSRLLGGCHPNRRTLDSIEAAGFELVELRKVRIGPLPAIVGVARPGTGSVRQGGN